MKEGTLMFSALRKSWLTKLSRSFLGRSGPIQPVERRRSRPKVEILEDRITPSTYSESLDGSGNLAIAMETAIDNCNLSFSLASGTYTFSDSGGLQFDNPTGAGAGFISGGNTNTITIPSSQVTSITVTLGTGTNIFTINGTDAAAAPLSVDTGSTAGDQVNISSAMLDSGDVSLTSDAITDSAGADLAVSTVEFNGNTVSINGNIAATGGVTVNDSGPSTITGNIIGGSFVTDGNFTTPAQNGGYTYNPTGSAWTFTGHSVLQGNGSAWGFPNTPSGSQSAVLQNQFSGDSANISQPVNLPAGTYNIDFYLCQRPGYAALPVDVQIDGSTIDTVTPTSSWTMFSTTYVSSGGSHTLAFNATNDPSGGDSDAGLWGASIPAAGSLLKEGAGALSVTGTCDVATTVAAGTLGGSGTVGALTNDATVNPGLGSTSVLNTGALSSGSGSVYSFDINGTTAGANYDQLSVTGGVNLTGATLTATFGYTPAIGDSYTIIHNVSNTPITGTFTGMPDNSLVTLGGLSFLISYHGGAGNDVTLVRTNNLVAYGESLDSSGNLTITQELPTANDNLSFSLSGGVYTFTDTGGLIFDIPTGAGAGFISGANTSTITVSSSHVTSITVTLGTGTNVFTITGTSAAAAPLNVDTGATAGDQVVVAGATLDSGSLTFTTSTIAINGGSVSTAGGQTYSGAVMLGADATLADTASNNISFNSTVDGGFNLAVNTAGVTTFGGAVGSNSPLASLTTNPAGTTVFDAFVETTGDQTYGDPVTLLTDATFISTGGNITFDSTVSGTVNLTVSAAGFAKFDANVTTAGSQTYNGPVSLGADITFADTANGNITFDSTVDGAFNLTVNTAGVSTFNAAVGSITPLASITTDAPGSTRLCPGTIVTSGDQTYNDPVIVSMDSAMSGSNITFASTVDGPGALTVNATGNTDFGGDVGSALQLGALTVNTGTMAAGNLTAGVVTVNDSGGASITGTVAGGAGPNAVVDGNFTTPPQNGGYTYDPSGSAWTFTGGAILQGNGSAWGFPNVPSGVQSAVLQTTGDISQAFNWPTGVATISFFLCERPGYPTVPVNIQVDGVTIDTVTNTASTWTMYSTNYISAGGTHTLTFDANTPSGGDVDCGIWGASVTGVGSGTLVKQGAGALVLTGSSAASTTVDGGKLGGSGTIGPVTDNATVSPGLGVSPTVLNTGGLSFGSGGVYTVALNGTASSDYDQLNVTGSINLTGGTLTGTLGYSPAIGDSFTIIHNVNNTPIIGNFVGLPESALVTIGGVTFSVDYFGGAGNDVVLTRTNTQAPAYGESLDASGNLAITMEIPSAASDLNFSLAGGVYTITDTNGLLFDPVATGANGGLIGGAGTHSITIPSADVTSISVTLGTGINVFPITGTSAAAAPLTVDTGATAGDEVNITGATLDSGLVSLTSNAITVGATLGAGSLAFSASTIAINDSISTAGGQTYTGPVTLGADATLADTASGAIAFGSTVDGGFNLVVNTGGDASFGGAVGGTTPLGSLTVNAGTMTAGDITAIGGVTVNDSGSASITGTISGPELVTDGDFTTPDQGGGYTYDPTGSAWTFDNGGSGGAILQSNGSAWGYPDTPSGSQSAGLQYNPSQPAFSASISQTFNWLPGTDTISFYLAQRPGYGTLPVNVEVDGTTIYTATAPSASAWTLFTTSFATSGGSHTLTFSSTIGSTGVDDDSGLWGVNVTGATSGALLKQGAGTLSLTGSSSVSATVSAGVLEVDGAVGDVTIPSGSSGLLSGTGTVGAISDSDATNPGSPADSVGTLNAASADFSGGGNLTIDVPSPSSADLLNVSGDVNLGGSSVLTVDLNGLTSVTGGPITVVNAGSVTGTFTTVNVVNNPNNFAVNVTYTGTTVDIEVVTGSTSPPPTVTSVVINQDISALYNAAGQPFAGAQRSMVNDIVYTFSEAVNIVSPGTDPNVFTVAIAAGWTGTVPTLSWTPVSGSGNTEWAVTFSGGSVSGGSIANGAYTITVNNPSEITAVSDSQALSLAGSGIGSATQSFYRLFGDINGDKFVNAADNAKFKAALTTYNAAFDYTQDGFVNASDNAHFKSDLTVNFSGFTPTI
jgi:Protein of unknown function (DUF642)